MNTLVVSYVRVDGTYLRVEYEGLRLFCLTYGCYGHYSWGFEDLVQEN